MTTYSVYLCDPYGTRLADASNLLSLKYTRVVNDVGSLVIVLPGSFSASLIRLPDARLEVWRRLDSGREYLDTETTWLIRALTYKLNGDGQQTLIVEADTPLSLLREPGRFVDAYAGSASSRKTDFADDMMKTIVSEQAGSTATDTNRDLSAYLSIAPDQSLGPSLTMAFAWRGVLNVLRDIAANAQQQGTYLAFDIVAPTSAALEFRTYTQQRGVDHRFPGGQNPILIGPDYGNMTETTLTIDYRDEVSYVKAGGQGEGTARTTATAEDDTRIGASPFGRREKFAEATNTNDATALSAVAQSAVRAGRPRVIFAGKLLDTPGARYGVHWAWGDYLTAQAFGHSFDCRVDAVNVSVEGGQETIEAWLRSDQSGT